jgi:hypothetical protein
MTFVKAEYNVSDLTVTLARHSDEL